MYPHENHQRHSWRSVRWSLPWCFRQIARVLKGWLGRGSSKSSSKSTFFFNGSYSFYPKKTTLLSHQGLVHQEFPGTICFKGLRHLGYVRIMSTKFQFKDSLSFMPPRINITSKAVDCQPIMVQTPNKCDIYTYTIYIERTAPQK